MSAVCRGGILLTFGILWPFPLAPPAGQIFQFFQYFGLWPKTCKIGYIPISFVSSPTLAFRTTAIKGRAMLQRNYLVRCVSEIRGVYGCNVCHHRQVIQPQPHPPICPTVTPVSHIWYFIRGWCGYDVVSISGTWPKVNRLDSPWSGTGAFISGMVCSQALDPMDCYHNILLTYKQHHRWPLFSRLRSTAYIMRALWKSFQERPCEKIH